MIEDWLLEKDEYVPRDEKNRYVEKSIFSLIKVISIIRQNKTKEGLIYAINPTLKVIATILCILSIAITRSFIYLFIFDIYILTTIFLMNKNEAKRIIGVSFVFPFMTLIALMPSILQGNVYNSLLIIQKMIVTILSVNILSHSTKWSDISKSLKLMFIPDMFIWIMDITIKYILLLGEYSIDLLYALRLRSVGISGSKYDLISKIMGNLFLKSYKMSEEMASAMECRGFVGEYTVPAKFKLRKYDYIYLILNIMLISIFVIELITS